MSKKLKKSLSVLLAVLMFVSVLTPMSVFADDDFETLDFTNDHSSWGPSGFTQFHFTITPYGADDIYANGYWEFDPDYTDSYTVITGEYGETITKLVVHYDEDCLPPEVRVNGEKVDGSAENGEMTYENLNASSVRVGAVEEYEDWNTVIIFSIDVYYTGGNAPDPSAAAIDLINAIGTVEYTDACKAKIDAARDAYNKLDDADKANVTNYDVLVAAEAAYQDFVDHDRANKVITTINNLGAVEYTAAYKIKLMNARNAYNGLTDTQKALVTNYDVLSAAEEDFAANSTIVNAGQFGGLYWMLDRDGVMTFSGKGEIPMTAFWHNSWIRKVIFNSSVTHIRSSSFSDSKNLTEVVFEAPVGVDNVIFMNSHNLAKVTLPEGFGRIGPYMFEGCTALDSIDIPASVNSIDKEVFAGTSIKTLVFRHGVAHTADSFDGMGRLETLVIANDSAINYTSAEFSGLQAVTNVYVPAGSTVKVPDSTTYKLFVKDEYLNDYDADNFASASDMFDDFYSNGCSALEAFEVLEDDDNFEISKYEYREVTVKGYDKNLTDGVKVPDIFGEATVHTYVIPTEAIDLFKSVGTIENDDECKAKIAEAKTAYEALTDIQKMAVKYYYKTVTDKETDINNREAAAAVTNQIGALPTTDVTLEDKAAVEAARAAYDALTDEQKALVDPSVVEALVAAETAIANCEAAAPVDEQINALPDEITLDDQAAVEAARAAYEALTDEQKAYVDADAYSKLVAAEAAIADLLAHHHTFGDWIVTTPATCTETGIKTRYCTGCDEFEEDVIPMAPHSFILVDGVMTCEVCGTVRVGIAQDEDGEIRVYVDGKPSYAGLIQDADGNYYYINSEKKAVKNCTYGITEAKANGLLPAGLYKFGPDGKMILPDSSINGIVFDADGEIRFYEAGVPTYAGLVQDADGNYYYFNSAKKAIKGGKYAVTKTNGLVAAGTYAFGEDGKMIVPAAPEYHDDGLSIDADGEIRVYVDGKPTYAGLVQDADGNYYYINSAKKAVKNCTYGITTAKANGLLPTGLYKFGADGKMILD